jgi:hypothetical protein
LRGTQPAIAACKRSESVGLNPGHTKALAGCGLCEVGGCGIAGFAGFHSAVAPETAAFIIVYLSGMAFYASFGGRQTLLLENIEQVPRCVLFSKYVFRAPFLQYYSGHDRTR